jgi:hypothetical protein
MSLFVQIAAQEGDERQMAGESFRMANAIVVDRNLVTPILEGKGVEGIPDYDLLLIGTVTQLHQLRSQLTRLLGPEIIR